MTITITKKQQNMLSDALICLMEKNSSIYKMTSNNGVHKALDKENNSLRELHRIILGFE